MDEKLSLEEQLKILYQEQSETENAYSENWGQISQSILVAWAKEILDREEKINELKRKIAEQSGTLEEKEEVRESTEEKSLVVVSKASPWQWIMRKINQMKTSFQQDVLGLNKIPGLSTEQLQELRNKRLERYRVAVETYQAKENAPEGAQKTWELTAEYKQELQEKNKNVLADWQEKKKETSQGKERED